MKYILLFLLFPILALGQLSGKVIKVKDGDTVVILDDFKKQHTIRVADIDCPEYKQPFSNKAKRFTSKEVFNKIVIVEKKSIDRYGRIVGYVFYSDKDLSAELLSNGYAWHFTRYSDSEFYQELQDTAEKNKIGLWIDKNPIAPWEWRALKNNN